MKKHVKQFDDFLNERAESFLNEGVGSETIKVKKLNIVKSRSDNPSPAAFDSAYNAPDYDWSPLIGWLHNSSQQMPEKRNWEISFTVPGVAHFEGNGQRLRITPIGDLKTNKFSEGRGTNFTMGISGNRGTLGSGWYMKTRVRDILNLIVRNCSRAALVDKLNIDFERAPGESNFNPSTNVADLQTWVNMAPNYDAGGKRYGYAPELVEALRRLNDMLPNELVIKAEIL